MIARSAIRLRPSGARSAIYRRSFPATGWRSGFSARGGGGLCPHASDPGRYRASAQAARGGARRGGCWAPLRTAQCRSNRASYPFGAPADCAGPPRVLVLGYTLGVATSARTALAFVVDSAALRLRLFVAVFVAAGAYVAAEDAIEAALTADILRRGFTTSATACSAPPMVSATSSRAPWSGFCGRPCPRPPHFLRRRRSCCAGLASWQGSR